MKDYHLRIIEKSEKDADINTALILEFFDYRYKTFFGWRYKNVDVLKDFLIYISFVSFAAALVAFPFLYLVNTSIVPGFVLMGLSIFLFGLYLWVLYGVNMFKFNGVSLRDKSPENIQKIYELFYIILLNKVADGKMPGYIFTNHFVTLAGNLNKNYWLVSPVLKQFLSLESSLYSGYEDMIRQKQRDEVYDKNCKLNESNMSAMKLTISEVRRDFLLKNLDK